jgi:multidomain signaling protein FimX
MNIGKDTALRLMLVADLVNEAEALVSRLRNSGTAVRPLRPESLNELSQLLMQQPVDLVLADYAAVMLPFTDVAQAVASCGRDIPLIALLDGINDDILEQVHLLGAQGITLRDRPQQFLKTIHTEWNDLETRRSQRRLEAQMRETQRRCDALIDSSREPIAYIHEGMHIRANHAYLEMFGFESFDDVEGMSLLDLIAPDDVDAFKALLKKLSKGEDPPPHYTLTARTVEGNTFPAVMEFTAAEYQGEACQQIIFRHQAVEMSAELALELERLRERDQATGLLNRQTFLHLLEDAVAATAKQQMQYGLLLLQPDNFQRILHEIGLDSTDTLLSSIADCIRQALAEDLHAGKVHAARFNDHSFAVLAVGDHLHTSSLAHRLRDAFAAYVFDISGRSSTITTSIGGVQIGEKIASVTQVLAKANKALQSIITVGGNHIDVFDPGAADRAEEERVQAWVARLRNALANDHFTLYYQPIIHLMGEPRPIYETYLRLLTETGEVIKPSNFLPIAEEHGLQGAIDRWVIARTISILGERKRSGKPVTLLAKISEACLFDEQLPAFIQSLLQQHDVSGDSLLLQLPESKIFINLRAAQGFASNISALGCRMVMDQFGAGLDSFQLLTHLIPSYVKIDRSFMEDLPKNPKNQQALSELAQKTREKGIQTIAEFVQDAASMTILFGCGIDYAEGDFLAVSTPEMQHEFEL